MEERFVLNILLKSNSNPISFAIFTNKPKAVLESYKRYILNNLRKEYSLSGVPIRVIYKKTDNPYSKKN